jgi:hypothetical protein
MQILYLKIYHGEMKAVSNDFSTKYYSNRPAIYSLPESEFLKKIDSLKQPFIIMANKYIVEFKLTDKNFIPNEKRDIAYFFDKMLLDYPYFHENHTGKKKKVQMLLYAVLMKKHWQQQKRRLKPIHLVGYFQLFAI